MFASQMPLNKTVVVSQTEVFRSTATRISADIVELVYHHQPSDDVVLRVSSRVDGSLSTIK